MPDKDSAHVVVTAGPQRRSSVFHATFNVFCAGAGAGIVGLPYALRLTSWFGLILLVIGALLSIYTGYKMSQVFNDDDGLMTYNDFGKKALGKVGLVLVIVCQVAVCVGAPILYMVLCGDNLHTIFQNVAPVMRREYWILICGAIVLPMCYLKSFHHVAFIAIFGALATIVLVIVLIVQIFVMDKSWHHHVYGDVGFASVLQGFSIMVFAYGAHNVFPGVIRTMKKPNLFGNVVMVAFVAMLGLYALTAIISYWAFGVMTMGNVLANLPNDAASIVIRAAITAHVIFAYPIYAQAIFEMTDPLIRRIHAYYSGHPWRPNVTAIKATQPENPPSEMGAADYNPEDPKSEKISTESMVSPDSNEDKFKPTPVAHSSACARSFIALPSWIYIGIVRTLYVVLTVGIALAVPDFGAFMALIGAATVAATIFMMPAGFYMKIYWKSISMFEKVVCFVIVILGTVVAVIGTVFAIIDMIPKKPS
jgi:amino acid permease